MNGLVDVRECWEEVLENANMFMAGSIRITTESKHMHFVSVRWELSEVLWRTVFTFLRYGREC